MRPLAQGTVAELFISQSIGGDSSPSDGLVEAINHLRAILNYYLPGTQRHPMTLFVLSLLLRQRHRVAFGNEECFKEAKLCAEEGYRLYQSEDLQQLRDTNIGSDRAVLSFIHAD